MSDQSLTDFVEEVCDTNHLRVQDDLGDGFVRLRSSEAQRRQAKHDIQCSEDIVIEMLRNARDAHATQIFVSTSKKDDRRTLVMIDDGDGIPKHLHERVFEPRVTSKLDSVHMDRWGVHGRGMALYSIAENSMDAHVVASERGHGTSFFVQIDLNAITERTDQSTPPFPVVSESKTVTFKGPRNIIRTVCEFAFAHRKECTVYLGSNAEIAATLYSLGVKTYSASDRLFHSTESSLAIPWRICVANEPKEFTEFAQNIGLPLSERTARRILDQKIKPLDDVYSSVAKALTVSKEDGPVQDSKAASLIRQESQTKVKISTADLHEFEEAVQQSYQDLAQKYYLCKNAQATAKQNKNGIQIFIPFEVEE